MVPAELLLRTEGSGGVPGQLTTLNDIHDQIILALIAVAASLAAGLVYLVRTSRSANTAAEQATQASNAVNHTGPNEKRLYDRIQDLQKDVEFLVEQQRDFANHGWSTLPEDLANATRLTETIRTLQADSRYVRDRLDIILAELREHVEWEMAEKYGKHGGS